MTDRQFYLALRKLCNEAGIKLELSWYWPREGNEPCLYKPTAFNKTPLSQKDFIESLSKRRIYARYTSN